MCYWFVCLCCRVWWFCLFLVDSLISVCAVGLWLDGFAPVFGFGWIMLVLNVCVVLLFDVWFRFGDTVRLCVYYFVLGWAFRLLDCGLDWFVLLLYVLLIVLRVFFIFGAFAPLVKLFKVLLVSLFEL